MARAKQSGGKSAKAAPESHPVDRLLDRVSTTGASPQVAAPKPKPHEIAGLRTARVVELVGPIVTLLFRGQRVAVPAQVAEGVDRDLIERARMQRDAVLVECEPGQAPVVVGVVQTRIPEDVVIRGGTVTIEADRELLLRSGGSAVRLRDDGDIEVVGSRIMAMSRGVFRIVGRMLRLN